MSSRSPLQRSNPQPGRKAAPVGGFKKRISPVSKKKLKAKKSRRTASRSARRSAANQRAQRRQLLHLVVASTVLVGITMAGYIAKIFPPADSTWLTRAASVLGFLLAMTTAAMNLGTRTLAKSRRKSAKVRPRRRGPSPVVPSKVATVQQPRPRHGPISRAGRLLPESARAAYVEEWQRWLLDLRDEGAPRHARLLEWLSILFVALPAAVFRHRVVRKKVAE